MKLVTLARQLTTVALIAATSFTAQSAHSERIPHGFLPENNLSIPAGLFGAGGITEKQYNQVLDRIDSLYQPAFRAMGTKLTVNRLWSDPKVNAYANKGSDNIRYISVFGGIARAPGMGIEGLALAVCHEIGHHLGGAPLMMYEPWATTEGGSDYFAALKCLRRYFKSDDNATILANMKINPVAKKACETQFANLHDQLICKRISVAGEQFAQMLYSITSIGRLASYSTPESTLSPYLNETYPENQCRLDTIFQGMLCTENPDTPLSDKDYRTGSCYAPRDKVGIRPSCWFVPN